MSDLRKLAFLAEPFLMERQSAGISEIALERSESPGGTRWYPVSEQAAGAIPDDEIALFSIAASSAEKSVEDLRSEVSELRRSIESLEATVRQLAESQAYVTFLTSLGQPELELTRPIPVTMRRHGHEFIASFFDANIGIGADTAQAAISSLQSLIVDFYLMHEEETDAKLGPSMRQQRSVLMDVICRRSRSRTQKTQSGSSADAVANV